MGHEEGAGDQARALAEKMRERDAGNDGSNLKVPSSWTEKMVQKLEDEKKGNGK